VPDCSQIEKKTIMARLFLRRESLSSRIEADRARIGIV
jgi:hypothetical protein